MKSTAKLRLSVSLPPIILLALFIQFLLSKTAIEFLTATPLREGVAVVLAGLVLLGMCYLAVPRASVHGTAASDGGEN